MKILIFGDSIAFGKWDSKGGWGARLREHVDAKLNQPRENNHQVYNLSIPGELAIHLEKRFHAEATARILADAQEYLIVFAVGINDANQANWLSEKATPPEIFQQTIQKLAQTARSLNAKVACIGLTPLNENNWPTDSKFAGKFFLKNVQEYDQYLAQACQTSAVPYLPLLDELLEENFQDTLVDGIHPDDAGHTLLFQKIVRFLEQKNLLPVAQ